MNRIKRVAYALPVKGWAGKVFNVLSTGAYMRYYTKYLKKLGIHIRGEPKYISSDCYFDGNDYARITLGHNITISREVMFLTHDYSINTAFASIGRVIGRGEGELYFSREIRVGDNCFIGARASILPGSAIGDNVIVGACAVVKGRVPDNSIIAGNPARVIGKTDEFANRHEVLKDYNIEGSKG